MPGEPREVCQIVAANLDQRFRLRHHVNDAAVIELQRGHGDQPRHDLTLTLHDGKTVETHVSSVLRKLQLSPRHELSRWAMERGVD